MGLLDFIFRKKVSGNNDAHAAGSSFEKVQGPEGMQMPKLFADNWSIIEETKLPYISITATPGSPGTTEKSSFGYFTRIPKDTAYPKDSYGEYMYPLAQISFREVPHLEGYPESGYLQFYISTSDGSYGLNFKDSRDQKDFRVLFFEEEELSDPQTDFSFLWNMMEKNESPVDTAHSLSFSLKNDYVGAGDIRFDNNADNIVQKLLKGYPAYEGEIQDALHDTFTGTGHKMGGYAYFTQADPRDNETENYLLLLQIDSGDKIMWGDVGVGNFFIDAAALKSKDFSKVLYNWDCC